MVMTMMGDYLYNTIKNIIMWVDDIPNIFFGYERIKINLTMDGFIIKFKVGIISLWWLYLSLM